MGEMEEKLGAILNNPQMMQQIMSLAQSLGQNQDTPPAPQPTGTEGIPFDTGLLKGIAGMARQSGADNHQKALLSALSPYLSRDRVAKLERAMQAAKMARLASDFLNSGGLSLLTGR